MIPKENFLTKNETFSEIEIEIVDQKIKFNHISNDTEVSDLTIFVNDFNNIKEIKEQINQLLQDKYWFLRDYWLKKKEIKEKFIIEDGKINIELYNYYQNLSIDKLEEIKKVITIFSNLKDQEPINKTKYFLIDNNQLKNPYTNEDMNGYGGDKDSAIKLYPAAINKSHHRIPNTSNLTGTLIHELAHSLSIDIKNKWKKKFSWRLLEKPIKAKGGAYKYYEVQEPKRCISEYAKFHPDEDLCDSLVAAITCPNLLDKERLDFINNNILVKNEISETVNINKDENNSLPLIKKDFSFKIKKSSGIKIN